MFVLTIDQQASTQHGDLVPLLLDQLAEVVKPLEGVALPFERTVGDEVQATLTSAPSTLSIMRSVLRTGGWSIGLGVGSVATPLPNSSRAASGPAFVHAREAVQRAKAKSTTAALAVNADDGDRASDLEALLLLLGGVIARRTGPGWEVIDALSAPIPPSVSGSSQTGPDDQSVTRTQQEVATMLGITRQAVNQRLKTAMWAEELAALPLAVKLLVALDTASDAAGDATGAIA